MTTSILSFSRDPAAASEIKRAYDAFGGDVEQKANAVVAWSERPASGDASAVSGCLSD